MNEAENDTREVILEWQVTTVMPRWWFDAYEEEGIDIYDAIKMYLREEDFETMMTDGTFLSVEATNTGASFRE